MGVNNIDNKNLGKEVFERNSVMHGNVLLFGYFYARLEYDSHYFELFSWTLDCFFFHVIRSLCIQGL